MRIKYFNRKIFIMIIILMFYLFNVNADILNAPPPSCKTDADCSPNYTCNEGSCYIVGEKTQEKCLSILQTPVIDRSISPPIKSCEWNYVVLGAAGIIFIIGVIIVLKHLRKKDKS